MKRTTIILNALLLFGTIHPLAAQEQSSRRHSIYQKLHEAYTWLKDQEHVYKAACAVVFLCGGWAWYYRNYVNHLRKKVMINQSECLGSSTTYKQCNVIQIAVKNQNGKDGGGAASCGYHSLKNGQEIIRALEGLGDTGLDKRVNGEVSPLFGEKGLWRNRIRARRDIENDTGEWLRSAEIEALMQEVQPGSRSFHCIDDMSLIGRSCTPERADRAEEAVVDYITPAVKEALAGGGTYIHQFFINTARTTGEGSLDSLENVGHWFVVVLHQKENGDREFIIGDSLNCRRIDDWRVKKLIDALK